MTAVKLWMKSWTWSWYQIEIKLCNRLQVLCDTETDLKPWKTAKVTQRDQDDVLIYLISHFQFDICVGWVPEILLSVGFFSKSDGDFVIQCFSFHTLDIFSHTHTYIPVHFLDAFAYTSLTHHFHSRKGGPDVKLLSRWKCDFAKQTRST